MTPFVKILHAIGIATVGNLVGRAANVLIPFAVVAAYGADTHTDKFFFIYAVAFFFFGTVSNAISDASIPLVISGRLAFSRIQILWLGMVCTLIIFTGGGIWHIVFGGISWGYAIGLAVLSGAGLANGLTSGYLFSLERFGIPGITWSLRLLPLTIFMMVAMPETNLWWLAIAIGLADWMRLGIMLGSASFSSETASPKLWHSFAAAIPAYGVVIMAAAIMGLNPVIDRYIAQISGSGSVSILETAERAYGIIATLCTIGMTSVLLTHLSKETRHAAVDHQWQSLLGLLSALCAGWMMVGIAFGWWGFSLYFDHIASLSPLQSEAIRQTYWYYLVGMPLFVIILTYIKRLQSQQRWWLLVNISLLSVGLNIPASLMLRCWMGVPGIALATSIIHIPVLLLLIFSSSRHTACPRHSK